MHANSTLPLEDRALPEPARGEAFAATTHARAGQPSTVASPTLLSSGSISIPRPRAGSMPRPAETALSGWKASWPIETHPSPLLTRRGPGRSNLALAKPGSQVAGHSRERETKAAGQIEVRAIQDAEPFALVEGDSGQRRHQLQAAEPARTRRPGALFQDQTAQAAARPV